MVTVTALEAYHRDLEVVLDGPQHARICHGTEYVNASAATLGLVLPAWFCQTASAPSRAGAVRLLFDSLVEQISDARRLGEGGGGVRN